MPAFQPLSLQEVGLTHQDAVLLSEMADDFDAHEIHVGHKRDTIHSTVRTVMRMVEWSGKGPWSWTVGDFEHFSRSLVDGGVKNSSLRKYQAQIVTFHDYFRTNVAYRQKFRVRFKVEVEDLSSLDNRASHKDEDEGIGARALVPREMEHFFDTTYALIDEAEAKEGVKSGRLPLCRDLAMFATQYQFGLRVHELAGIHLFDFHPDMSRPDYGDFGMLHVLGKAPAGCAKPERTIPVTFPTAPEILKWYMNEVRPYFVAGADPSLHKDGVPVTEFMFLSERGTPISKNTIQSRFKLIRVAAGFGNDPRVTTHSMRKSFATHNYHRGMDLDTLRRLLGHMHLSTTQTYLDLTNKFVTDDIRKVQTKVLDHAMFE